MISKVEIDISESEQIQELVVVVTVLVKRHAIVLFLNSLKHQLVAVVAR